LGHRVASLRRLAVPLSSRCLAFRHASSFQVQAGQNHLRLEFALPGGTLQQFERGLCILWHALAAFVHSCQVQFGTCTPLLR
jgi:hypothetical protein